MIWRWYLYEGLLGCWAREDSLWLPSLSPLVTSSTQLTGLRTPWSPILALVTMLLVFCDIQSATLSVSRNLSAALRWAKSYEKCNSKIRKEPRTELLAESALPQIDRGKNQRGLKSFPFRVIIKDIYRSVQSAGFNSTSIIYEFSKKSVIQIRSNFLLVVIFYLFWRWDY